MYFSIRKERIENLPAAGSSEEYKEVGLQLAMLTVGSHRPARTFVQVRNGYICARTSKEFRCLIILYTDYQ